MKLNFPKSTKIRIIVNDVGVFTTVGKYVSLFMNGAIVNATLLELEKFKKTTPASCGLAGRFFGIDIRVDLI